MKKLKVTTGRRGEIRLQSPEYVPPGPVRLASQKKRPPPPPGSQYRVGVPEDDRVPGIIYDAISGVELTLASEEDKAAHPPRVPWETVIGGMKQRRVIW